MEKEPKTIEEKIRHLKDSAPYLRRRLAIYGSYNTERRRLENYYLHRDGTISAKDRGNIKTIYTMTIEGFANKFGEEALNFAINILNPRVRIPKNSS